MNVFVMEFTLNVINLNCWGIPQPYPIGSRDRIFRMNKIADELSTEKYDIVALQEIWSEVDFILIRDKVEMALPYSHYFHSGFTGSGVCIFSKSPIIDTAMHRYSLNGYAHHVHRGDWFGGKVVGLARIRHQNNIITVYTTHVHAEYDREADMYLPHRVVQAYELSQFVRMTSSNSDITLVMGDLNLEPDDLGYKIIRTNSNLRDSWLERTDAYVPEGSCANGMTCERPANLYADPASKRLWPDGKRIDYVLYNSKPGTNITVKRAHPAMGVIPGCNIPYSDHDAVYAELFVQKNLVEINGFKDFEQRSDVAYKHLEDSVVLIDDGLKCVAYNRRFFLVSLVILSFFFFYTIDLELTYQSCALFVMAGRFITTLLIGFCFWYGVVVLATEEKAFNATKLGIQVLLRARKLFEQSN